MIHLKQILDVLYERSRFKPVLVAPGGFYQKDWYNKLLQVSGSGVINVLTHHIYNLGPGLLVPHLILLYQFLQNLLVLNISSLID